MEYWLNMQWIILSTLVMTSVCQTKSSKERMLDLLPTLERTIDGGRQNIWAEMEKGDLIWNMPPYLGKFFLSEYYFELKALNVSGNLNFSTSFQISDLTEKLLAEQRDDGSWPQIVDLNKKMGSLDASIFNYWFLKDIGMKQSEGFMQKARQFILSQGGLDSAQMMTRYKLAVFGQYEWSECPYVPLRVFKNEFPYDYLGTYAKGYTAQWIYPHLIGLAYLRYHKTIFRVSNCCLSQLTISRSGYCQQVYASPSQLNQSITPHPDVDVLLEESFALQGSKGLFGGYTISTLLILMSYKDYSLRYIPNKFTDFYHANVSGILSFVEALYFNRRTPYEGNLCDGRYWDTLLASYALLESGERPEKVSPIVHNLMSKALHQNGGIAYGLEFEYAPDIDDTAVLMVLYGKLARGITKKDLSESYKAQISKTYDWIKTVQNADGGFGAFSKGLNDYEHPLIKFIFKITQIDGSAQIFDPSCADIVGHMLEGLGDSQINSGPVVNAMISYLKDSLVDGVWSGRWGINYIYAIGAVIPGLARVGYNLNESWVRNVIHKLVSFQQEDGGFGEDSQSYNTGKYINGVTTVSMTAWGLLAYLEVTHLHQIDDQIERALRYILRNYNENNSRFRDRSVVGTGHRGLLNLQYNMYAYSFPLVALARAKAYLSNKRPPFLNEQLNADLLQDKNQQL